MQQNTMKLGILAALISNVLFGVLYIYSDFMAPMNGSDVFAWRMVAMLLALLTFLSISGGLSDFARFVRGLGCQWRMWSMMLLGTAVVGSQLWLFMWGPVNGEGVNVAMGYFLFPLTMIIGGRLFLKEPVYKLQWVAVAFAAAGVANELWVKGAFSWATLWVCGTYPIYYLSRRCMRVAALQGLTFDLILLAPLAVGYLVWQSDGLAVLDTLNKYWLLVPLLGVLSAAAMQLNLAASRLLPVTLFGLFSYLEPMLLFMLAVVALKAPLTADAIVTYGMIWCGLLIAIADGVLRLQWQKRRAVVGHATV